MADLFLTNPQVDPTDLWLAHTALLRRVEHLERELALHREWLIFLESRTVPNDRFPRTGRP